MSVNDPGWTVPLHWRGAPVAGAVLAGGQSRRFGRDKARFEVGGVPMLTRALSSLAGMEPVFVVAGSPDRAASVAADTGAHVVPDDRPGAGPIGGIATALRLVPAGWVAVLGVDLPLLPPWWWRALMQAADAVTGSGTDLAATSRAVAVRASDGRWEPLAALYHTSLAREAAERAAPGGDPALHRLLTAAAALAVAPEHLPAGALRALHNVNAPADAEAAERAWATGR